MHAHAEARAPLLLTNNPMDAAILQACEVFAIPAPTIPELNSLFLGGLIEALAPDSTQAAAPAPHVIIVSWHVTTICRSVPPTCAELLQHVLQLEAHFQPRLSFSEWSIYPETLDEIRFKFAYGTARDVRDCVKFRAENESDPINSPHAENVVPQAVDCVALYLAARAKNDPLRSLQKLQLGYRRDLRDRLVAPLRQLGESLGPLQRSRYLLVAEAAGASLVNLVETIAERTNTSISLTRGRQTEPFNRAIADVDHAFKLIGELDDDRSRWPRHRRRA
jgi:hypothetical protein